MGLSVAQKARVRVMLQVPNLFPVYVSHTHTPSTCHLPRVMLQEQYKAQDEAMGVGSGGGIAGSESAGLARGEVT